MNIYLIYPMFAMVLLTVTVLLSMFIARISAIREGKLSARYFKTYNFGEPTEAMVKSSRHFANLFELPVLFYAGCLTAMILPMNDGWILGWAWLFVAARLVHAYIHIGKNKLLPRMISYTIGWIALLALWLDIVVTVSASLK